MAIFVRCDIIVLYIHYSTADRLNEHPPDNNNQDCGNDECNQRCNN